MLPLSTKLPTLYIHTGTISPESRALDISLGPNDLFETITFSAKNGHPNYTHVLSWVKYPTEREAIEGHERTVARYNPTNKLASN